MQISEAAGGAPEAGAEPCRFPKLEECAHFHYERVQLPPLDVTLQTNMDQSLHSQHTSDTEEEYYMIQVTSGDECWLLQRNLENFKMLDAQLHQCIYDRKISQLPDLSDLISSGGDDVEAVLISYLERFCCIIDNSLNCGPILNWLQMDNKGHRLLVPSEESRSINTPAVAAAYSVRRYVSQARDELNLEVGDMISVIDMASPGESMWWRGKRGFQVGFFPQRCVHIIGDKVPRNMPLPPPVVGSLALSPIKPVLRKHGKLIAFFRSFILNRPSRRRLKQSGILKERVFGCDLGEHLLNSGHDIPTVLKCCAEFIEENGIVDGIYRLSGVTSNIQKLRNAFDEDRIPNLYTEEILQDIHSVASLLKMYFRELPNPLCTYQLYQSFVNAVQGCNTATRNSENDHDRLLKMREAVQKLPPPHYRTLEYLTRHLARVAKHGSSTGMTTRNVAIVWAPNLLRSEELEGGGVAALQGVGVQAVVTEFLICYADLIFCDHLPVLEGQTANSEVLLSPKRSRPKSLAISTPTKLITLEEARNKHQVISRGEDSGYIEVGGGPNNLPKKYHTIIELPSGRKRGHSKRSPSGWRSFFSKSRNASQSSLSKSRKASTPGVVVTDKFAAEADSGEVKRKLRTVKSAESLVSGLSEPQNNELDVLGPLQSLSKPSGHNRSVSHDSYFDTIQSSQNNSEGSLLDLSEIQLNFDLEESEMRIFSEDESLVSSPRTHKDIAHRKYLMRARPEDFGSAANSNNPSPKKQARVVLSPDSLSRKRTRLEDQLSDIQFIDCNTPDNNNGFTISTTAVVHTLPPQAANGGGGGGDSYQPKNKSPRNSHVENNKRASLNLEQQGGAPGKTVLPKSLTEVDIGAKLLVMTQSSTFATPTPQSPLYKPLADSNSTTPGEFSPLTEICYNKYTGDVSGKSDRPPYENVAASSPTAPKPKGSPTYENVLTTISITYKSPVKRFTSGDSIYEDVNPEGAVVPTTQAVLPTQGAADGTSKLILPTAANNNDQRPKSLSALEELKSSDDSATLLLKMNLSSSAICNSKSDAKTISSMTNSGTLCRSLETTLNSSVSSDFNTSSVSATPYQYIENNTEQLLSPTDLSLSEIVQSSSENLSSNQPSYPMTPVQNSLSPNVSPAPDSFDGSGKTRGDTSESSLVEEEESALKRPELLALRHDESLQLSESPTRPVSANLFDDFDGPEGRMDKRKSCETETTDDNSIYQQVKYFRRSVHEINALLELENNDPHQQHIYENVEGGKVSVKSLTNKFEIKAPPTVVCGAKKESFTEKICNLVEGKARGGDGGKVVVVQKVYDRDCPPPCVRARNLKHVSVKTRSLDEREFTKECRSQSSSERRKSLDENLGYNTTTMGNPKLLSQPKTLSPPSGDDGDDKLLHLAHSAEGKINLLNDQKLNRERIEKYKEERRKILHERYRSESFKEDKDVLLMRLKIKPRDEGKPIIKAPEGELRKKEGGGETESRNAYNNSNNNNKQQEIKGGVVATPAGESLKSRAAKFESPPPQQQVAAKFNAKKVQDVKVTRCSFNDVVVVGGGGDLQSDIIKDALCGEDFVRNRRRNDEVNKSERRRHTYDLREREGEQVGFRRVSLETKSPRKEKTSPSLCIKDMKAIFESKSQQ